MKIITKTAPKVARGRNLTLAWGIHPFPAGKILIAMGSEELFWLGINCGRDALEKNWPGAELVEAQDLTAKVAQEIARLWPKKMESLSIPLVLCGTPFQLRVWKTLLKIPAGKTRTYTEIARAVDAPRASRAVGAAVGANPVSIVVPCHRVVHAAGSAIGYAWGPAVKRALLKGEGAI